MRLRLENVGKRGSQAPHARRERAKLRQVEALVSQGQTVDAAARSIGVTQTTYHRWRNEFGGPKLDQVKRLKELEAENARLRRTVAGLTLGKMILTEAARGS